MREKRMPKGWISLGTDIKYGSSEAERRARIKREKKFADAIANIEKRSYEKMQEDSEKAYNAKVVEKMKLLQAYDEKKLKSKDLIKYAKTLKKHKKDAAAAV